MRRIFGMDKGQEGKDQVDSRGALGLGKGLPGPPPGSPIREKAKAFLTSIKFEQEQITRLEVTLEKKRNLLDGYEEHDEESSKLCRMIDILEAQQKQVVLQQSEMESQLLLLIDTPKGAG